MRLSWSAKRLRGTKTERSSAKDFCSSSCCDTFDSFDNVSEFEGSSLSSFIHLIPKPEKDSGRPGPIQNQAQWMCVLAISSGPSTEEVSCGASLETRCLGGQWEGRGEGKAPRSCGTGGHDNWHPNAPGPRPLLP